MKWHLRLLLLEPLGRVLRLMEATSRLKPLAVAGQEVVVPLMPRKGEEAEPELMQ